MTAGDAIEADAAGGDSGDPETAVHREQDPDRGTGENGPDSSPGEDDPDSSPGENGPDSSPGENGPDGGPGEPADEPGDSVVAPTIGLLAAGVAAVVLFAPAEGTDAVIRGYPAALVARGAAVLAVVAFALVRQGFVPRRVAGVVAAVTSIVVVLGDMATLQDALTVWPQPAGVPVATLAGTVAVFAAIVEIRALSDRGAREVSRWLLVAAGVGVLGFFLTGIGGSLFARAMIEVTGTATLGMANVFASLGFGIVAFAFVYLVLPQLGESLDFLDIGVPSLRDIGIGVLAFVILIAMSASMGWLVNLVGVDIATSQLERQAEATGNATFLLYLIPVSWIAIAPGEELIYRNVVQKYLYDGLTRWGAVVAASAIFAAMHLVQYFSTTPGATIVSLTQVFLLSLILGATFERTENIVVPILVHGAFNSLAFLGAYVRVTQDIPAPGILW